MLCFLHFGLKASDQPRREQDATRNAIEATLTEGKKLRNAGKFGAALEAYGKALSMARLNHDVPLTIRGLMLISGADIYSSRYQASLAASKEAFELASQSGDDLLAGGASVNVSDVYFMLGDFWTAETEGRRGIDLLKRSKSEDTLKRVFLVKAMQLVAILCSMQGRTSEGEEFFDQAIALAQQAQNKALEASLWDVRGEMLLRGSKLAAAEQALNNGLSLRQGLHDEDTLPFSYEHLAELELRRRSPNYATALHLVDQALASKSASFRGSPQYYPIHMRGEILLRSGQKQNALVEFRRAVTSADEWRQGALPGDATNTQTVVLLHSIYHDFAQLAAQISIANNNSALRNEALEVLAANRAASLREQLRRALAEDAKLPDSYYAKLSALQAAQARVTLGGNSKSDQVEVVRLRTEIGELENKVAVQNGKNSFSDEKNLSRIALRDIQTRLGRQQLLLSFSLGDSKSYLWAVAGDQVTLYQIDARAPLEDKAARLTQAVRDGGNLREAAQAFEQAAFGVLPERLAQRPEWLIVGDGELLSGVPFAALPAGGDGTYLIDKHSLRFLPSELLLLQPNRTPVNRCFVGVADPIYNLADSRRNHRQDQNAGPGEASSITLARLAGSGQEVRKSAQACGLPYQQILDGAQASSASLRRVLESTPPELLHFAVHVVSPPGRPQDAALALSLTQNGMPELLTPEVVSTFRLGGTLVVLSGCSSNQGKSLPSAGLLGLSRAWLLAGAEAVVASAWPTPDDSGKFFSLFYSYLHADTNGSLSRRAAHALSQTQEELRHSQGYTSSPAYWAAYSLISKE